MTLREMIDDLEIRLYPDGGAERSELAFTADKALRWLNRAQLYVARELDVQFVRELHATADSQALGASDGSFDLTGLSPEPIEGEKGILSVQLTGGKHCDLLDDDRRRGNEDSSKTYGSSRPVYWLIGQTMYVRPYSGHTIDLEYKKLPTDMAFDAGDDPSGDTSCALDDVVQELIVEYAAGLAGNREAKKFTESEVRRLNNSYRPYSYVNTEVGMLANKRTF